MSAQQKDRFADYVSVAERIEKFYELHPKGRVCTSIVEHDSERGFILMRAEVYRHPDDAQPSATGHAYEYKESGYVQKTSYIEVCETSAVGRALALLGFEVKRGIASREEMEKVRRMSAAQPRVVEASGDKPTLGELFAQIKILRKELQDTSQIDFSKLDYSQAESILNDLKLMNAK
jgi:hypothetical protein